jgi:two-component system alkaline phosphatase synthesis response regulator PhoP
MNQGQRLLLCDDEVHILRAAEFKLTRAGYVVECAYDGQEAWEAIQRQRPDMLVTDCQMPRLNGLELIERVRTEPTLKDLPIIMLTAKGLELAQCELADRWNVRAILGKPFSPRELLRTIENILGGKAPTPSIVARPAPVAGIAFPPIAEPLMP